MKRRKHETVAEPKQNHPKLDRQQIDRDLASLQGTYCPTVAEKYQILLKRDNLLTMLAKLQPKPNSKMLAEYRMGTCTDMCPEKERYCRQVGNLLHPYECNPDGRLNHALAVKDYSRSAADQDEPLLHELRPPDVLQKTMDYLILKMDKPMSRSELSQWYDFTWSRTRAIRKEITQQIIVDEATVSLVEKCARFHIYASYCMANFEVKDFDERMNTENLSKCLQTLRHMYDDLSKKSIFCESEPEFRAYDILLNLGDSNVLSVTHTYHRSVRDAPIFKLAMKLTCAYQTDNFVSFFRLIRREATFLQACLCRSFFDQIRAKALHSVAKTSRPPTISVAKFTQLLAFDNDEDTQSFMKALDMYPEADGMIRYEDGYQLFSQISDGKTNYGCQFIREKIHDAVSTIIAGGPCIAPVFSKPVDSFDSDYYGKKPEGSSNMNPSTTPKFPNMFSNLLPTKSDASNVSTTSKPPSIFNNMSFTKPNTTTSSLIPKFTDNLNSLPSTSGTASTSSKFPNIFANTLQNQGLSLAPKTNVPELPLDFIQMAKTRLTDQIVDSCINKTLHSAAQELRRKEQERLAEARRSIDDRNDQKLDEIGKQLKTRLTDEIIVFCIDDFVWLAAQEVRRREKEVLLGSQRKIAKVQEQKLPEFSREMKVQLFKDVIGFCIDDFVWLAAKEVRAREARVSKMLEKHNMRILRPYVEKWKELLSQRRFFARLPELSNSGRKRHSIAFDQGEPNTKRSKKFTPLNFSNVF